MGGECYKMLRVWSSVRITTDHQEAYAALHPVLLRLAAKWRSALSNPAVWDFDQRKDGDLFRIKFVGDHSDLFAPLVMPLKLIDNGTMADWHVGWRRRRYGTYRDPSEDLAETLMAALRSSTLGPLLYLDQEDNIREDLNGGVTSDYCDDGNSSPQDFAACDKECGYCGHCDY